MTNKSIDKQRATRMASKQDRDRDAAIAMQEYEAEKAAVLARTARLRASRLARDAKAQAAGQTADAPAIKAPAIKSPAAKAAGKRRPAARKTRRDAEGSAT
jgi:hypothetical protein